MIVRRTRFCADERGELFVKEDDAETAAERDDVRHVILGGV